MGEAGRGPSASVTHRNYPNLSPPRRSLFCSCLPHYTGANCDAIPGHSMARTKTSYVCQACGAVSARWQGRCEACGEWNTIAEEIVDSGVGAGPKSATAAGRPIELLPSPAKPRRRRASSPASVSSTGSPAAASSWARPCWSAAIRASANPPCCCRPRRRWPSPASASSTSRAKRPWRRCACGPSGSGSATAGAARQRDQCRDHPRHAAERPCPRPDHHRFDPDAVDRPGRQPRPAPSRRCAPRRRR